MLTSCLPTRFVPVRLLYNLALSLALPLALPYWIVRSCAKGHALATLRESLGWIPPPPRPTTHSPIWFHAVSVGEIQSSLPLLRALRKELPDSPVYVSTTTATGRRLAEAKLQGLAQGVFRAPVDLPGCSARVFRRLRPRLLIVAETELWPNLFFEARRHGTATVIVNGRISDRTAPRYRRLRWFFGPVLSSVNLILAQSEADRGRFLATGADPSRTLVAGNLKYDIGAIGAAPRGLEPDLERLLDRCAAETILVFGSTREGEETLVAPAISAVSARLARSLHVVAPRHPRRFDEAADALAKTGLPVLRRTQIDGAGTVTLPAILILDTIGELAAVYSRADLVFVGGSLNGWGGHNVLEAVVHGRPVVVGPFMQNFRSITEDLLGEGGLLQVNSPEELAATLLQLATDREQGVRVGQAGQRAAESRRGASALAAHESAVRYRQAIPCQPPSAAAYIALRGPAAIWKAVASMRRRAYRSPGRRQRLETAVISVGNLTVGGTGKTPTVAWLTERLTGRGFLCGVLTRGYGRQGRQLLATGTDPAADPRAMGDEPAMLARRLAATAPGTLFGVAPDRHLAGRRLERIARPDFLILDDGFQHLKLARDLEIVLVDASAPFGNGYTLPLGTLREASDSLRDADIVLLTRCRKDLDPASVVRAVHTRNPGAAVYFSSMVPTGIVDLASGEVHGERTLAGRRVVAFCGVGNPASFFSEARRLGCHLVLERAFRDHHRYTRSDLLRLQREAKRQRADAFLTTAKDAMNLSSAALLGRPAYALEVELAVEDGEGLVREVLSRRVERAARRTA